MLQQNMKILMDIGVPLLSSAALGKYQKPTLLDVLKIHFQRFFALSFLHLMSNGLNGVDISWLM